MLSSFQSRDLLRSFVRSCVCVGKLYKSVSELVDSVLAYEMSLADVEVSSRDLEETSRPSVGSRGHELQPLGDWNETTKERNELVDFDEVDSSRSASNTSNAKRMTSR